MISRALVAILLMMNLGVAAWWLWGPAAQIHEPIATTVAGIPELQLLEERDASVVPAPVSPASDTAPPASVADAAASDTAALPPADNAPSSVTAASPPAASASPDVAAQHEPEPGRDAVPGKSPAASQCFSIGPFEAIDDVRRTSALIESALQRQQVREVRSTQVRGYRVYLPPFPTRQEAMDAARALQEKGLRDYYVVTAGEQENTVSLGLFRDLANAESRREQVRSFGFEPRLEPRQQELTRWWLDIAVAADDAAWRGQATRFQGTRIEPLPCQ